MKVDNRISDNRISQEELDRRLSQGAVDPEHFTESARKLARELHRKGTWLETKRPHEYRRTGSERRTIFVNQFETDVQAIQTMDRDEEARLARRIELSRMLVDLARKRAGLPPAEEHASPDCSGRMPPEVARRERELHALRTEMVERNLYLVLVNVDRYAQSKSNRWDLIQEGSASLFRAVDGFDWRRGLLFRTYAVHWLNQAFRNHLYNFSNTVRVPVYLQKALKHINQAQIRLGDPKASVTQIAATADMSEKLVSSAIAAARSSHSMDVGLTQDGDGNRLRDLLADDEEGYDSNRLEDVSLESGIARAMDHLSDRERRVISMRFGLGVDREYTLAEVAHELGVSVERVRQIQVRAVAKMDTPTLRKELDPYLN